MSMTTKLDEAYEALQRWESWADGRGAETEEETIGAFRLMGALTAASALAENPRPTEYIQELIDEVYELINGDTEEEE